MATRPNKQAFDYGIMRTAAKHWRQRQGVRRQTRRMLEQRRYDKADTKERLAKRVNRLLDRVRRSSVRVETLTPELASLAARRPVTADEISNDFVERVIGATRDFLSIDFLERGLYINRCVGRVVTSLGGGRQAFGTGFLVSPTLLMTNNHVLPNEEDADASSVEFDYQVDRFGQPLILHRFDLEPKSFFLTDPKLDYALVAVKSSSHQGRSLGEYTWCSLIGEEGKIRIGEMVNIIQHPRGEMKQVVIRENQLFDLLELFAHYGSDTERGSSGSPVFNDQWEVVALHHSGVPKTNKAGKPLDVDGKLWRKGRDDPDRLAWVANEGVRVSRLVKHIKAAKIRPHEEELRREFLASPEPPRSFATAPEATRADAQGLSVRASTPAAVMSGNVLTITLPIRVAVALGTVGGLDAAGQASAPPLLTEDESEPGLEAIRPEPNYAGRPGYRPKFLGVPVPLPVLSNAVRAKAFRRDGVGGATAFELKYHHFSVIMNRERRLAFVAAVNFDASAKFRHPRRDKDRWFVDPRVDPAFQAGDEFYADNPLDRGHLVMRADAAWGRTVAEAKRANDDTFHFTNCSPQHEIFNQAKKARQEDLLLWGNIEEHIAAQGKTMGRRLTVFNGPVFRSTDRPHRGLPVPKEFWKVVVYRQAGKKGRLRALAFILSQEGLIANLPLEEFEVGPYRPFQVRVREIEARTKLDFGDLSSADPLLGAGSDELFEARSDSVLLTSLDDIVL